MVGRSRRRFVALGATLTVAFALAVGALVVLSGAYNVAASVPHFYVTDRLLKLALWRSVDTHSLGVEVPPLDDPGLVRLGARHFVNGCEACHAAPGIRRSPVIAGMYPTAPDLSAAAREWQDRELFWIVRHGLKFTGMPQWPGGGRPDEVWALVAFLRALPGMSAADYAELAAVPPRPGRGLSFAPAPDETFAMCASCHGDERSPPVHPLAPSLAGQKPGYLARALAEYADDRRQSGMMEPIAAALSEDAMRELADRYAAMPAPDPAPAEPPAEASLLEAGRRIAVEGLPAENVPACLSCHSRGSSAQFPLIAGLSEKYIAAQLRLFRDGKRAATPHARVMTRIAGTLDAAQSAAVAAWLATATPDEGEDVRQVSRPAHATTLALGAPSSFAPPREAPPSSIGSRQVPPPLTPPLKGEGDSEASASATPSPLRGSEGRARQVARPDRVRGGGARHYERLSTWGTRHHELFNTSDRQPPEPAP